MKSKIDITLRQVEQVSDTTTLWFSMIHLVLKATSTVVEDTRCGRIR